MHLGRVARFKVVYDVENDAHQIHMNDARLRRRWLKFGKTANSRTTSHRLLTTAFTCSKCKRFRTCRLPIVHDCSEPVASKRPDSHVRIPWHLCRWQPRVLRACHGSGGPGQRHGGTRGPQQERDSDRWRDPPGRSMSWVSNGDLIKYIAIG